MGNQLGEFFDKQSEETKIQNKAAVSNADTIDSGQSKPLEVTGRFRMEVSTFAWKKDGETKTSPDVFITSKKKALMMNLNLRVADSVAVPKGSSIFTGIVLVPGEGSDQEKLNNTARMMKPKVVALTGTEDIDMSAEWIEEWLLAKFEELPGDKFKIVKDHKMKQHVMVTVDEEEYEGDIRLAVQNIEVAKEGEESVTYQVKTKEEPKQDIAPPSQEETDNINPENAVIQQENPGPSPESNPGVSVAGTPDDF